mgnify:CR=1 FL=1|tara:strand:+ start:154008 stop:154925 length:918 start_codon:yes stop_codon:yes gene_type:complete
MNKIVGIICVSVAVAGCTPMYTPGHQPSSGYYPQSAAYGQQGQQNQPVHMSSQQLQQQQQVQAPVYVRPETNETVDKVNTLIERVRRVERAMLRLDRRMQLIERNELSRMSNGVMSNDMNQPTTQGGFQPMSYEQNEAQPQRLPAVQRPYANQVPVSARGGYQPVSYQDNRITSSLGVASATANPATSNKALGGFAGMPSLADDKSSSHDEASSVSIWTISYESGKVWPGREQLTSSREVIEALSSDKPVALYARGAKPSSKEFRERVRAVSKYLSKVSSLENVPIASMPAKHMERDTIEIIVTK